MTLPNTLLLGFLAGATILLGLPVGRVRGLSASLRTLLSAVAVGILIFLVWDVLSAAWEPIDSALLQIHDQHTGYPALAGYGALFAGGLAVGLLGLVAYERSSKRFEARRLAAARFGPGAMSVVESEAARRPVPWSQARRLAVMIAVGIGVHNLAEGLAIGQSAASGQIGLATLLVIGFGLHNATEGFGIVAPLAADEAAPRTPRTSAGDAGDRRPSWFFLLGLGLVGGGPTFVGTALGYWWHNTALSVAFLALAAGSILYVVLQLIGVAARSRRTDLLAYGVLIGLLAGFMTDAVVTAAGV
jgi:ZIP family zinc transporter